MQLIPLFSASCCWWCICIIVNKLQTQSLVYCSLGLGTPRWLMMGWGHLISHFWMETYSGKLPCLVPIILSWVLWISRVEWSGIHISRAPWLFGWTVRCPQCVHLWRMCVDSLVIKFSDSFKFIISMVVSYGKPSVVVTVFDLI